MMKPVIEVAPFPGWAALAREWTALEARARVPVFQCWSWVGCLAEDRFPAPVLLRATVSGVPVGLALFNRRGRTLYLTESGDAALDAPFIEHNAPLVAADAPSGTARALLRAAWDVPGIQAVVASGAPPFVADALGRMRARQQDRVAPFVDLAAIRAGDGDYLATRSANTRQQIRRSLRRYGDATLARAADAATALEWLDGLIALHEATWRRRGKPGAFASPFLRRFHAGLVARTLAAGQLDMLRFTAAGRVIGYLYNFRGGGTVYAYQSGLEHIPDDPQRKPGLTCHTLAIAAALREGDGVYDFLGGDDRYKQSLASGAATLCWTRHVRPASLAGLIAMGCKLAVSLRFRRVVI